MEAKVYNKEGAPHGSVTLPAQVFDAAWNPTLVHDVVVAMQSNARAGTAHAKDRSEVKGGGKKPWRQKGTGRARHGSIRSPIWRGGGVTHGPRTEKRYDKKINRRARIKALASVLSRKYADGEVVFVHKLQFVAPRAKQAKETLNALAHGTTLPALVQKPKNAALIVLATREEGTERSFRNFDNVSVVQAKDVNPVQLLTYKYVVIASAQEAVAALAARVARSNTPSSS